MLSRVAVAVPNVTSLRLVNGAARGADAAALTSALLQWSGLRALQLHQVRVRVLCEALSASLRSCPAQTGAARVWGVEAAGVCVALRACRSSLTSRGRAR
jgi:hypothetical protein